MKIFDEYYQRSTRRVLLPTAHCREQVQSGREDGQLVINIIEQLAWYACDGDAKRMVAMANASSSASPAHRDHRFALR